VNRAVLFDYGGTLDGAGSHWFDRFLGLYRDLGVSRSEADIKEAFYRADREINADARVRGWGLVETVKRHVAIQLGAMNLAQAGLAQQLVAKFMAGSSDGWKVSSRVLNFLAGGFKLAIVSNFFGNLEQVLVEAGLRRYFDAVIDSAVVGVRKPERKIFDLALSELAIPASNSVFVGDSLERDMVPAKSLGMRTVWIAPRQSSGPRPEQVDWLISSLTDLEGLPL